MWLDDNTVIACSRCDAVFWTHIMSPVLISILCILFVKLGGGRCFLYVCICVFIFEISLVAEIYHVEQEEMVHGLHLYSNILFILFFF